MFDWGLRTYVMGILNVTPDSFSGDGVMAKSNYLEQAVAQALLFESQGADMIDIGGESTRPGSDFVEPAEEIQRVAPVIRAIRAVSSIPISVDTYKAEVAEQALEAGADWINDVWALRADPQMARLAAQKGCPVVLMHNRSKAGEVILQGQMGGMYKPAEYMNLLAEVIDDLRGSIALGLAAGMAQNQFILDPGIGFGKTVEQNLELINRLDEIAALGYPVLLAPSRKSFIGQVLQATPDDRLEGTMAAVAVGITRGADMVRVHDVKAGVRTARMTDALVRLHQ
jgi:dihydropteroate synthase